MNRSLFSIGYGIQNREREIHRIAKNDHTHAVILAAVHFEWMIKRTILALGNSPTAVLRKNLEGYYFVGPKNNNKNYKTIWKHEMGKNSALGTVLGNLAQIQNKALKTRGLIIHGNGTVSEEKAMEAIDLFLDASRKLNTFAKNHGTNLDSKLKTRRA